MLTSTSELLSRHQSLFPLVRSCKKKKKERKKKTAFTPPLRDGSCKKHDPVLQSAEAAWGAVVNLCQAGVTYMHPSFQKQKYCYSSCCGKYRHPLLGIFMPRASHAPNRGTVSLQLSLQPLGDTRWNQWTWASRTGHTGVHGIAGTGRVCGRHASRWSWVLRTPGAGQRPQKWREQS